jgi:hypothetical protein
MAQDYDCQYFFLDEYDELVDAYGNEAAWEINDKFLEIQMSSGREIYLSTDPEEYFNSKTGMPKGYSAYSSELKTLYDNGYRFQKVSGGLYRAIQ